MNTYDVTEQTVVVCGILTEQQQDIFRRLMTEGIRFEFSPSEVLANVRRNRPTVLVGENFFRRTTKNPLALKAFKSSLFLLHNETYSSEKLILVEDAIRRMATMCNRRLRLLNYRFITITSETEIRDYSILLKVNPHMVSKSTLFDLLNSKDLSQMKKAHLLFSYKDIASEMKSIADLALTYGGLGDIAQVSNMLHYSMDQSIIRNTQVERTLVTVESAKKFLSSLGESNADPSKVKVDLVVRKRFSNDKLLSAVMLNETVGFLIDSNKTMLQNDMGKLIVKCGEHDFSFENIHDLTAQLGNPLKGLLEPLSRIFIENRDGLIEPKRA